LRYLLRISLKQQCKVYYGFGDREVKQEIEPNTELLVVRTPREQQRLSTMTEPIAGCQIVGSTSTATHLSVFLV
jgi:hypothetical protein